MINKCQCLHYKGQYYDIGTKVKLKDKWNKIVIATYKGRGEFDGISKYAFYSLMPPEHYIVEIIEPVYYQEKENNDGKKSSIFTRTGSGSWQSSDEVFYGLTWYIAVMLVGIIFKDRWLIWIIATWIFFGWKKKK